MYDNLLLKLHCCCCCYYYYYCYYLHTTTTTTAAAAAATAAAATTTTATTYILLPLLTLLLHSGCCVPVNNTVLKCDGFINGLPQLIFDCVESCSNSRQQLTLHCIQHPLQSQHNAGCTSVIDDTQAEGQMDMP